MIKIVSEKPRSRPLSPHLSVYRLEKSSGFSIYHRITGVLLTVSVLILGLIYKLQTYNIECFATIVQKVNTLESEFPLIVSGGVWFVVFAVVLILSYHIANGLRHLVWDSVISTLSKEHLASSSYIVLGLTLVIFFGLLSTQLL